jgi:xylulose-5-phosphate/fructose-6-phosphate phosphoketolase
MTVTPLDTQELESINAYWRACNYLAAGMMKWSNKAGHF